MEHEVDLSPHMQSQDHTPKAERKSHGVHEHHHPSAQPKATTTLTAPTSMISASINYNVNVQFDPKLHKQANQLT